MSEAWVVALVGGGSAIVGGMVSGAYQHARDHWNRPRLEIDFVAGERGFLPF